MSYIEHFKLFAVSSTTSLIIGLTILYLVALAVSFIVMVGNAGAGILLLLGVIFVPFLTIPVIWLGLLYGFGYWLLKPKPPVDTTPKSFIPDYIPFDKS